MENYYTVQEFAKYLNCHPETIKRAIRAKAIIAVRPGGGRRSAYRIPESELKRMTIRDMYLEEKNVPIDKKL